MSIRFTMVLFAIVLAILATLVVVKYPDYVKAKLEAFQAFVTAPRCPKEFTCTPITTPTP